MLKRLSVLFLIFSISSIASARVMSTQSEVQILKQSVNNIALQEGYEVVSGSVSLEPEALFSAISGLYNYTLGMVVGQDHGVVYTANFLLSNGTNNLNGDILLFTYQANDNSCSIGNDSLVRLNSNESFPSACVFISKGSFATQQSQNVKFEDLIKN